MPRAAFDRPIAHRGLHDRAEGVIENSRSAFAGAIAHGFAIECDLQLTRDGVPVVFHDDRLERLTGLPGLVRDISSDELLKTPLLGSAAGDCPQTLGQLLEQVAGQVLLQLELKRQLPEKTRQLAAVAAANVARYKGALTFESFDPWMLTAVRKAGSRRPIGIITEQFVDTGEDYEGLSPGDRLMLRHLLHWPWTRFDFLSVDRRALALPAVRAFRALGKSVTSWTIRSQEEARLALTGADQIVFEGFIPASA
jgi:glycerophosphoryl diester phosphodiesterase